MHEYYVNNEDMAHPSGDNSKVIHYVNDNNKGLYA